MAPERQQLIDAEIASLRGKIEREPWQMTREEFATPVLLPVAKPGNIVLYHRLYRPEHLESVISEGLDISKKQPGGEGPTNVIWAVTSPSGYSDAGTIIGFEVPKSDAMAAGTDQFMVSRSILPMEIVYVDKEHSLGCGYGPKRENEQRNSEYAERIHEVYIEKALAEGKPVPPEVLAEYPDLAPTPRAESLIEGGEGDEPGLLECLKWATCFAEGSRDIPGSHLNNDCFNGMIDSCNRLIALIEGGEGGGLECRRSSCKALTDSRLPRSPKTRGRPAATRRPRFDTNRTYC
jgi:hypothetical protein